MRNLLHAAALAAFARCAFAQAPPEPAPAPDDAPAQRRRPPVERIEIREPQGDSEIRRQAIAGKIVVGREEIERYGDTTVGEVLRRLPSITLGGRPGRGGEIRMRGMGGGFTQILVDGERMPAGLALETITADQIERIELFRAPTAEHGAQAIAGTINIVLREPLQRRLNDVRLTAGLENGRGQPHLSWTRNDVMGTSGAYNVSLSASRQTRLDDVTTRTREVDATGTTLSDQQESGPALDRRDRVVLSSRLRWPHGPGESFTLSPFVVLSQGANESRRETVQIAGPPPGYSSAFTQADSDFAMLRLNALEQRRIGRDTRLELRGMVRTATWRSQSLRQEFDATQALTRTLREDTDNTDRTWRIATKLTTQLAEIHSVATGVEMETTTRDQQRTTLQNGAPLLFDLGDAFGARIRRSAAYLQDEWEVTKTWSAHAGLRVERIDTHSDSSGSSISNSSTVWTPLLHSVWKLDPQRRDQVRASLTRSYRAPGLQDLIARPALSARYAPPGPNVATSPDRVGNPNLKPELATGVELAYERYLTREGGVLSANLFHRRIESLIRSITTLEVVPWAAVPRWVVRSQNLEGARVSGLELEAKLRLDELVAGAPQVSLRSNLSLYRSNVEGVPGPDHRIDRQSKASGNLGADYRLRSAPVLIGGSIHWVPAYRLQSSATQSSITSEKRTIDLYALWTIDRNTRLRCSASNWLARDYANSSAILTPANTVQSVENSGPTWTAWQVRLEVNL